MASEKGVREDSLELAQTSNILITRVNLRVRVHLVEVGEPIATQEALARLGAVGCGARARLLVAVPEEVAADVRAVVAHLRKRLVAEPTLVGLVTRVHSRVNVELPLVSEAFAARRTRRGWYGRSACQWLLQ